MDILSHYGPSLCVKFFDGYVYAGYGPFIYIYDYHTGELKNRCRIFDRNKVHGVKFSDSGLALCFGSRSVSLVPLKEINEQNSVVQYENYITEWIITGEFNYENTQFFLLTCYNRVLSCDLNGDVIKKSAVYGEKSILYSGSIKVLSANKVYINAGTVMGGIVIWDLFSETLVANLLGHSGSIFYVTMSGNGSLVASCSDDRSVRLWDLKTKRELSVGWGHTARIWNLMFFNKDSKLISVSEDCTCRVWAIQHNRLLQRAIYEVHLSKNVWGVDVEEKDQIAITSGNDGRLRLIELEPTGNSQQIFTLKDISMQSSMVFNRDEIIKGFHWFHFGFIAITSTGKILQYDDLECQWKFLFQNDLFSSYSVTNGITDANVVVFSNNNSQLLMLKFDPQGKVIIASKEIRIEEISMTNNCMICHQNISQKHFFAILESPNPRDPFLCLQININTLQVEEKFKFIKPENFSSSCLEIYGSFLLVGSRFSTIAIFNLENAEQEPYVFRRLTPGDTTTSILFIESSPSGQIFAITNRDGYYNFVKIKLDHDASSVLKQPLEFEIIHYNKVARGFLEGAFYDASGDFITFGFKSEFFYIYNETQCYEISSQVCGGAHRQWKFSRTPRGFTLIFIRASDLYLTRIGDSVVPETLRCGTHGREIRDISILKDPKYRDGYLFCTASEDTTIKVCHVQETTGKVSTFWTHRKHVSGLQRCKLINERLVLSSSAREELFLWELTTDCKSKPYMNLRQTLPVSGENPDLRIMDFAARFDKADPQQFILATVYSDSAIKLWRYNYLQNKFYLVVDGRYETCCLLNVSLFSLSPSLYMIISTTKGRLVIYNISNVIDSGNTCSLPDFDCSIQIHQSGIQALSILVNSAGRTVTAYTGGDDNGLGICCFHRNELDQKLVPQIKDFQRSAASSTITSCKLLNDSKQLLTTSVDQIVRKWSVSGDRLLLQDQKHTSVADTGSLDVVDNLVLIGGVGLSVWKTEHI